MKILHIIDSLSSGGAEKLIEQSLPLYNEIDNVKADVLLLTDANNVFDKPLIESGIVVEVIKLKKMKNPFNIFYIKNFIMKGQYDIVHVHLFPANYWTSLASLFILKKRPKFVFTEHNTYNKRRDKYYLRPIEKFIYSKFDKVISISQKTQENLVEWLRISDSEAKRFTVIENGISLDRFIKAKPYRKSEISSQIKDEDKLICMIGRFSQQKQQGTLIKALKCTQNKNVSLLLVGEGPLKHDNEKLAKDLGVEDRVYFLGFRIDVERIIKTADIVVISSRWEGFGLVAAEAMASGKPIIASNVDGLREVVGMAGILFSEGDYYELALSIDELLTDADLYQDLSFKSKMKAIEYDIRKMVSNYYLVYKELLL